MNPRSKLRAMKRRYFFSTAAVYLFLFILLYLIAEVFFMIFEISPYPKLAAMISLFFLSAFCSDRLINHVFKEHWRREAPDLFDAIKAPEPAYIEEQPQPENQETAPAEKKKGLSALIPRFRSASSSSALIKRPAGTVAESAGDKQYSASEKRKDETDHPEMQHSWKGMDEMDTIGFTDALINLNNDNQNPDNVPEGNDYEKPEPDKTDTPAVRSSSGSSENQRRRKTEHRSEQASRKTVPDDSQSADGKLRGKSAVSSEHTNDTAEAAGEKRSLFQRKKHAGTDTDTTHRPHESRRKKAAERKLQREADKQKNARPKQQTGRHTGSRNEMGEAAKAESLRSSRKQTESRQLQRIRPASLKHTQASRTIQGEKNRSQSGWKDLGEMDTVEFTDALMKLEQISTVPAPLKRAETGSAGKGTAGKEPRRKQKKR